MKINGQVPIVAEVRWGVSHNNLVFLDQKSEVDRPNVPFVRPNLGYNAQNLNVRKSYTFSRL